MYIVIDTYSKNVRQPVAFDQYGHVKVYATEKAARRKANSDNNAVSPKMDRYEVGYVNLALEFDQGRVICS